MHGQSAYVCVCLFVCLCVFPALKSMNADLPFFISEPLSFPEYHDITVTQNQQSQCSPGSELDGHLLIVAISQN